MALRSVFAPLEPTREPRWYVVRNMHNAVLEARPLPAGGATVSFAELGLL